MVHALHEIWRVLVSGGFLIDMRPFKNYRPVEIVTPTEIIDIGFIDSSAGEPDDIAAHKAMVQVVDDGHFKRQKHEEFEFLTYWDSVDDLRVYMDGRTHSTIDPNIYLKAERIMTNNRAEARLRTRRDLMIDRYQRLD